MKRPSKLSIKARVTIWYTAFMILIMGAGAFYLLSLTAQISTKNQRESLMDVVADAVKTVRFDYGELDSGGVDFYQSGVSIFIYDTKGRLLAPKVNRGIQVDSILTDQYVRTVDDRGERWMVYDLYAVSDDTGFWVRGVLTLSATQEYMKRMGMLVLVAVPVFVLTAALGGYLITRHAFFAVGEMAETADAISSGMDLSSRVRDDGSGDELSRLGGTINSMLERLQNSFNREKQFTSDVSHELRTPTAVIISQCEYALAQGGEKEKDKAVLVSLRQARRISSIISQLLMLVRAENGKYHPEFELLQMGELCEMIVMEHKEEAGNAGVLLEADLDRKAAVYGDETLIIRMVTNLLSNAIRYNRPGGTARLTVKEREELCVIEVEDSGIGIKREDLSMIWERFYRVDASRSGEGSGLGLSMVRWIAGVHGGSAEVESCPGKGSLFRVLLPKAGGKAVP